VTSATHVRHDTHWKLSVVPAHRKAIQALARLHLWHSMALGLALRRDFMAILRLNRSRLPPNSSQRPAG
jgi:hypothetical protein